MMSGLKTYKVYWDKENGVLRLHEIDENTGQILKDVNGAEASKIFSQWSRSRNPSDTPISHNKRLLEAGDDALLQE